RPLCARRAARSTRAGTPFPRAAPTLRRAPRRVLSLRVSPELFAQVATAAVAQDGHDDRAGREPSRVAKRREDVCARAYADEQPFLARETTRHRLRLLCRDFDALVCERLVEDAWDD